MSYRQSSPNFNYSTPLKHNQTPLFAFHQFPSSTPISFSQPSSLPVNNAGQLHQLRIKCSKIDQIQKYANILVDNIERYKLQNEGMTSTNKKLMGQIQLLRAQCKGKQNQSIYLQEKVKKEAALSYLSKLSESNDKKMQQELSHELQKKEKALINLQQKHKIQMTQLQSHLKININRLESEKNNLHHDNDSLFKENTNLKVRCTDLELINNKIKSELDKIITEMDKYKDMLIRSQDQLSECQRNMHSSKTQALQVQTSLKYERDQLARDLEESLSLRSMLQKMNSQLKIEGADIIFQSNQIKERTLQLEELHCIDMRAIESYQVEIETLLKTRAFLEDRVRDGDLGAKGEILKKQEGMSVMKRRIQQLQIDNMTKQKQIKDLIGIVGKLQQQVKITASTAMNLQKQNIAIQQESSLLKQQAQSIKTQVLSIQQYQAQILEYETLLRNTSKDNQQLSSRNQELSKQNLSQKTRSKNVQQEIQLQKIRCTQLQLKLQRVMGQKKQMQQLSSNWKVGSTQFQKLYSDEKKEAARLKEEVSQLKGIQLSCRESIHALRQEIMGVQQENKQLCQEIKSLRDSLGNIDTRYQQLLNSKKQQFASQIYHLQKELLDLTSRQ